MQEVERRRAIVVGASSGIGEALARRLARDGYAVALVARRAERLHEICEEIQAQGTGTAHAYVHDVRATAEVAALFEKITAELRGLDLIAYVAGVMPQAGEAEYDTADDREVVETNLTGAIAWLNEAALWLSTQGSGSLVGISSMAGERGRRAFPSYCASKAGLNAYLEALRNRVSQSGVHVLTVKPGFVRTRMLEGRSGLFWVTSPEDAADRIVRAVAAGRGTIFVSPRWRLVSWVIRSLPSFLFRRLAI